MSARRHGAEVIADKLREGLDRWPDRLGAPERDAIGLVIHAFEQIAAEDLGGNEKVTTTVPNRTNRSDR